MVQNDPCTASCSCSSRRPKSCKAGSSFQLCSARMQTLLSTSGEPPRPELRRPSRTGASESTTEAYHFRAGARSPSLFRGAARTSPLLMGVPSQTTAQNAVSPTGTRGLGVRWLQAPSPPRRHYRATSRNASKALARLVSPSSANLPASTGTAPSQHVSVSPSAPQSLNLLPQARQVSQLRVRVRATRVSAGGHALVAFAPRNLAAQASNLLRILLSPSSSLLHVPGEVRTMASRDCANTLVTLGSVTGASAHVPTRAG